MNFRTTVVLIVLLAAAGVWLFIDRRGGEGEKEKTTQVLPGEGRKILDWDSADVTKVAVTRQDGSKTVLTKADGKWKMTEPLEAPAESFEVDGLIRDVLDMRSDGRLDNANPATTGLDKPKFTIELTGKAGKTTKVAIGDRAALGSGMYVSLDGSKSAEVVNASVWEKLNKPVENLRAKELVTTPAADIKQMRITKGDRTLELQKVGNDWQLTRPEKMPADDSAVSDMTWAVSGLRAASFVKPDEADETSASLKNPQMSVWFSAAAPATQPTTGPATAPTGTLVRFGGYDTVLKQNVYASVSSFPTLAKVSASTLERFDKKPLELRDKRVIDADPEKVSTFTIDADLSATTQPTSRPASKKHVVVARRVENPVIGPQFSPPKPGTGPTTQPTTLASTQPSTSPTTLASSQPATQPATAPVELAKWEIKSTPAGEADDSKVTSLLNDLHPLRVQTYLDHAATTQATTRPTGKYTLKVTTIDPGGATKSYELSMTDTADGKLIGTYNGLTFEMDHSLVSRLEEDYAKKPAAAPTGSTASGQ